MTSTLVEKQKMIDYFRNFKSISLRHKPCCVNEVWWKIYNIEKARLTMSPKKEIIRKEDLKE